MLATDLREPHVSHCKKNSRVSFWRSVSGDLQVWHVTYSSATQKDVCLGNHVLVYTVHYRFTDLLIVIFSIKMGHFGWDKITYYNTEDFRVYCSTAEYFHLSVLWCAKIQTM